MSGMKKAFMKCALYPGMFPSEWTVEVHVGNGEIVGAWVDKGVVVDVDPAETQGKLRVFVLGETDKGVVCHLPEGIFPGKSSFFADAGLVEYAPV